MWRKIMDNEFYNKGPFDSFHAWTDLILLAYPLNDEKEKPGTLRTSLETLKIRWNWDSRHKVRDFLGRLKGRYMIDYKTCSGKGGGVLITITNYETYQRGKPTKKKAKKEDDGTLSGTTRRNTSLYPTRIYKEEGIFESSPEGDSKTPSEENNGSGSGVMSPEAFMRKLEAEKEKEGNGDI